MNGAHDLGGIHGFGPINPEPEQEEPVFHQDWEKRVLAITLACGMHGKWSIDMSRFARERQSPAQYLKNSYYETWTEGLETLLVEHGLITPEELENGSAEGLSDLKAISAGKVPGILAAGGPTLMDVPMEPLFEVGDKVRVKNNHPAGHTRAPRYVRGREGTVIAYHGVHVFADANSLRPEDGGERRGEPLYGVCFEAGELWGEDGSWRGSVSVDLWQPYLEGE